MTTKTEMVTAKFGGREGLVFSLDRETLPFFEAIIGEPAQVLLARISTGRATVGDIRDVLEYAAPAGLGRNISKDRGAMSIAMARMARQLDENRYPTSDTFVAKTLAANPPMKYGILAQGILAAALFGIPEEAATFDEDEEAGDDDAA